MSSPSTPADLFDLKLLPSWVKETPPTNEYADFAGEESDSFRSRPRDGERRSGGGERRPPSRRPSGPGGDRPRGDRNRGPRPQSAPRQERTAAPERAPLPPIDVYFLPNPRALESVVAQIKNGHVAYSVFALARMFLEKPERYQVRLTTGEETPLAQMGENGPVAADARILEGGAFQLLKDEYYKTEVVQGEPIKGNFASVARCRLSGTLLGPTNHHAYQPRLRGLYEERFSRRMSFPDYQRQIEMSNDPAAVEAWKEEARNVTTFTTTREEPPVVFTSATEVERHFRQTYLPQLIRTAAAVTISGVVSRSLPDRALGGWIEEEWSRETRSPSRMMQEIAGALRGAALNIFRQRRGMLFVSPVRLRPFGHDRASVSPSIGRILEAIGQEPGITRKQLSEREGAVPDDKAKLSLASDLRWLVSEGYVIEFNDGSLDLPRVKQTPVAAASKESALPMAAELPSETKAADAISVPATATETEVPAATPADESVAPDEEPAAL